MTHDTDTAATDSQRSPEFQEAADFLRTYIDDQARQIATLQETLYRHGRYMLCWGVFLGIAISVIVWASLMPYVGAR